MSYSLPLVQINYIFAYVCKCIEQLWKNTQWAGNSVCLWSAELGDCRQRCMTLHKNKNTDNYTTIIKAEIFKIPLPESVIVYLSIYHLSN